MNIGEIFIINKFKVKKTNQPSFRCIMIYQDNDSGFCFIKPLLYKIDLEIVMELFRIFVSYGPPKEVHVNSCSHEMVTSIGSTMKMLCPFSIDFVKSNTVNTNLPMNVVTKLHKWMEKTNRDQWEIGCCIVQRQINTELVLGKQQSPHDLFFKGCESDIESDISDLELDEERISDEENISNVKETVSDEENISDVEKTVYEEKTSDDEKIVTVEETISDVTSMYEQDILSGDPSVDPFCVVIKEEVDVEEMNSLSQNLHSYVVVHDEGVTISNLVFGKDVEIKEESIDIE